MTGKQDLLFGILQATAETPLEIFERIFQVFLVLGTIVGIVVIGYTLYNARKYRDGSGNGEKADVERPQLGELPTGGSGGKKLFVSFGISAVIVISLVIWTYGALLDVESGPAAEQQEALEVEVEAYQFGWEFKYPNGASTTNELVVPRDQPVELQVTARDVFHNFGIPEFRIKADAIPGETTTTWFEAPEEGTYHAQCYELCGAGHSFMDAEVVVMEPGEFEDWYEQAGEDAEDDS